MYVLKPLRFIRKPLPRLQLGKVTFIENLFFLNIDFYSWFNLVINIYQLYKISDIDIIFLLFTYKNIITAGKVKAPPIKKNAPGNDLIVALYTALYIGPYINGTNASQTPNNELACPRN